MLDMSYMQSNMCLSTLYLTEKCRKLHTAADILCGKSVPASVVEHDAQIVLKIFCDVMLTPKFLSLWHNYVNTQAGFVVSNSIVVQSYICGAFYGQNRRLVYAGSPEVLHVTNKTACDFIIQDTFWHLVYKVIAVQNKCATIAEIPMVKETDNYYQEKVAPVFVEMLNKHVGSRKRINLDFEKIYDYYSRQVKFFER